VYQKDSTLRAKCGHFSKLIDLWWYGGGEEGETTHHNPLQIELCTNVIYGGWGTERFQIAGMILGARSSQFKKNCLALKYCENSSSMTSFRTFLSSTNVTPLAYQVLKPPWISSAQTKLSLDDLDPSIECHLAPFVARSDVSVQCEVFTKRKW
jgi:hypothetical protein